VQLAVNRSPETPRPSSAGHAHLWSLPDGTGLHAPLGLLFVEQDTGLVCCHLCGRWWVSPGAHVWVHGHTAMSYREAMGLGRTAVLAAEQLSSAIGRRQQQRYTRDPQMREHLEFGRHWPDRASSPGGPVPPTSPTRRARGGGPAGTGSCRPDATPRPQHGKWHSTSGWATSEQRICRVFFVQPTSMVPA